VFLVTSFSPKANLMAGLLKEADTCLQNWTMVQAACTGYQGDSGSIFLLHPELLSAGEEQ
jgi:hypothetical protein